MFMNYENVPSSYIPNNITPCKSDLTIKKKPLEEYDASGALIGYSWYYGDQVVLEFNTTGNVVYDEGYIEDASTYFSVASVAAGKRLLKLQFFDFRYEEVYCAIQEASVDAKFYINNATSERFVRGAYKCKLTLIQVDAEDETKVQTQTLIDVDDYIFCIK